MVSLKGKSVINDPHHFVVCPPVHDEGEDYVQSQSGPDKVGHPDPGIQRLQGPDSLHMSVRVATSDPTQNCSLAVACIARLQLLLLVTSLQKTLQSNIFSTSRIMNYLTHISPISMLSSSIQHALLHWKSFVLPSSN